MVRQCAWCRVYMGESVPYDDTSITHGICLACMAKILAEAQQVSSTLTIKSTQKTGVEIAKKV